MQVLKSLKSLAKAATLSGPIATLREMVASALVRKLQVRPPVIDRLWPAMSGFTQHTNPRRNAERKALRAVGKRQYKRMKMDDRRIMRRGEDFARQLLLG